MGLSEDSRQRIIENNRKISKLLAENEEILKAEGYKPPIDDHAFSQFNDNASCEKYLMIIGGGE